MPSCRRYFPPHYLPEEAKHSFPSNQPVRLGRILPRLVPHLLPTGHLRALPYRVHAL